MLNIFLTKIECNPIDKEFNLVNTLIPDGTNYYVFSH